MKKFFGSLAVITLSLAAVPARPVSAEGHNDLSRGVEKRVSKRGATAGRRDSRVLRLGPSETYLKNGLSLDEVIRLLGKPTSISERREGSLRLTTCIFPRSAGRIIRAEFENGVLVRSSTEAVED
ncbi:MAG TPA: hypothetical protein VF553_09755 [Pyrinomonadaceae bacterium]|jgi:hypothetical protein